VQVIRLFIDFNTGDKTKIAEIFFTKDPNELHDVSFPLSNRGSACTVLLYCTLTR
jgi:hypothetical protein